MVSHVSFGLVCCWGTYRPCLTATRKWWACSVHAGVWGKGNNPEVARSKEMLKDSKCEYLSSYPNPFCHLITIWVLGQRSRIISGWSSQWRISQGRAMLQSPGDSQAALRGFMITEEKQPGSKVSLAPLHCLLPGDAPTTNVLLEVISLSSWGIPGTGHTPFTQSFQESEEGVVS